MFDEATIAQMRAIFDGAVKHDRKWKLIPASDARLRAMAKIYYRDRDTIYYMELNKSLNGLTGEERKKLHHFWEQEREGAKDANRF